MSDILVVDDDVRMAEIIERGLRGKNYRVNAATSGLAALNAIAKHVPDLMILDVNMPDLSGFEVCHKVRSRFNQPQLGILFLSGASSTEDKVAAFEAGADDYLTKPFDLRELELRINALLRRTRPGGEQSAPVELQVRNLRLNTRTFKALVADRSIQLTPVEFELLQYLMLRAGEVISAEQLLQEVWHYYPGTGDPAVVRVQIMNLRDKIEQDRRAPTYIQTVYRHGYMVAA